MARLFKPGRARRASAESTPQQLLITDLAQDGRGVARHQGKAVFVRGALPGETVSVNHYRRQKRFSECVVKQVLTPAAERCQPRCLHYEHCGGCQLQHLQVTAQPGYKQQALLSQLKRHHDIRPSKLLTPVVSSDYGYRTRVRLSVNGERQLALHEYNSDRLVPVTQCPVLTPLLQSLLKPLQSWLSRLASGHGVTHLELFDAEPRPMVVVRHTKPLQQSCQQELQSVLVEADCGWQAEKHGCLRDVSGEPIKGLLSYALGGLELQFAPGDFTQVNPQVNQLMVDQALAWLQLSGVDQSMDLFCGIGNFSLPMADCAGSVIGVEAIEAMVERARHNARNNRLDNVEFMALDLESGDLSQSLRLNSINKLLLDPPRAGAAKVCEQIAGSVVERLVYVSCNPASFARDAGILCEAGFDLAQLRILDMFPQTAHVETMALFVRTKGI